MRNYLLEVKQLVAENPIINLSGHFNACTPQEVAELEREIGLKLPLAYKEFLLWAGKGLGVFEEGSTFYYDQDLIELQQTAREFLIEDNFPKELPDDAFVFWMHQGYMFCFFRMSEGDNPLVHNYSEGRNEGQIFYNKENSFTDFWRGEIKDQAENYVEAARLQDEMARDWRNS